MVDIPKVCLFKLTSIISALIRSSTILWVSRVRHKGLKDRSFRGRCAQLVLLVPTGESDPQSVGAFQGYCLEESDNSSLRTTLLSHDLVYYSWYEYHSTCAVLSRFNSGVCDCYMEGVLDFYSKSSLCKEDFVELLMQLYCSLQALKLRSIDNLYSIAMQMPVEGLGGNQKEEDLKVCFLTALA